MRAQRRGSFADSPPSDAALLHLLVLLSPNSMRSFAPRFASLTYCRATRPLMRGMRCSLTGRHSLRQEHPSFAGPTGEMNFSSLAALPGRPASCAAQSVVLRHGLRLSASLWGTIIFVDDPVRGSFLYTSEAYSRSNNEIGRNIQGEKKTLVERLADPYRAA